MRTLEDLIASHPFFSGLAPDYLSLIAGCGRNARYELGQFLAREGEAADTFFIIRSGRVAVETHITGRGAIVLETLGDGDVGGWSWLFPPYRWTFDLRALDQSLVVCLDGRCLRDKCEQDPRLGFELMKRFAAIMTSRLRSSRLQLLDLYGRQDG